MPTLAAPLTAEQQAAARHCAGHARILAVAGAGKTATLTHYLAQRVHKGAHPERLLVLMYNRAAQQSFQQRLQLMLPRHQMPRVRTFHALGLRLYQGLVQAGALPPVSSTPMAEAAVEVKLKQILQHCAPGDGSETVREWLELAVTLQQRAKSELGDLPTTLRELAEAAGAGFLADVILQFEHWRRSRGLITFDDMLYDPAQLFHQQPETRDLVANRLDEILVDEYQDVNPVQHFLLQVLAGARARVMVIGDPDQTIYEFRGSSPAFITHTFAQDFPAPTHYQLSRTFRFGHSLALLANHLISHNREREPILTISAPGTPNTRIQTAQTADHGARIAATIERLRKAGAACGAMAVLCRLWSYARPVELELLARGIPYRIEGEQSILQCREIKPFWHCLELLCGRFFQRPLEQQEEALFELLTIPSGKIPHAILRRIAAVWVRHITADTAAGSLLRSLPADLSAFQKRNLQQLAEALLALAKPAECAKGLLAYAQALEFQKRLRSSALNPTHGEEQAATVEAFLRFTLNLKLAEPSDLLTYLQGIQNRHQQESTADAVILTSVHRSKGLEWPVVFLPNLAEGHMPYLTGREEEPLKALESERRLLYVALTRAQKQLFITLPDPLADQAAGVSRFVGEMRMEVSCAVGRALSEGHDQISLSAKPGETVRRYLTALDSSLTIEVSKPCAEATDGDAPRWQPGQRVRHSILGEGEIQAQDARRLHIRFADGKVRVFASDLAAPHLTLMETA